MNLSGRVLDVGTGGGFPGIPLAIMNSEVDFYLLDSVGKKITAIKHFVKLLDLQNVHTLYGRTEDIIKTPGYAKSFDFIVSRATAYLPKLVSWCIPYLKDSGIMLSYKLPGRDELNE